MRVSIVGIPIAIVMALFTLFSAAPAAKADVVPFNELYPGGITGTYGIVNVGMGLEGAAVEGTGTLVGVNVPGPVVSAYLVWQGRDDLTADVGDDIVDGQVSFAVDGGTPTTVNSTVTNLHVQENVPARHYYSFLADVTTLVQQGTHDYTFSDFVMPAEEFGWGLFIVYDTGNPQIFHIQALEGLDRFWKDEPNNVHGAVHCVDVDPKTSAREIELDMIAAGIGLNRDNQIYYQTGLPGAAKPTNLNTVTGGTGTLLETQPLGQYDGPDWDSYENANAITLPADHGWICVQITANELPDPSNQVASGMIQLVAFAVPLTTPTAVSLSSIGVSTMPTGLTLVLIVIAALVVITGTALIIRRRPTA